MIATFITIFVRFNHVYTCVCIPCLSQSNIYAKQYIFNVSFYIKVEELREM